MTTAESAPLPPDMQDSATDELVAEIAVVDETPRWYDRLEAQLARAGDYINPILVKETRQALKSKQFTFTFALLLLACWMWSIGGVALVGPSIQYSNSGMGLFTGYFLILAFPLAVIVPFSAFRSLAAEREDNTFELLSVTALGSRQVISGKLGSSLLQIMIYLSALAPCLAFTYMLRGIDILTIGTMLVYASFGSLGLAAGGLLLATLTRERYQQVVLSVVLIVGLCVVFVITAVVTLQIGFGFGVGVAYFDGFWVFQLGLLNFYSAYFALVFLAAAARLTFPSENRSTPLRLAMIVPPVCLAGWISWPLLHERFDPEGFVFYASFCSVHWYLLGALMVGESPLMSARVKRGLPQSVLGRLFLTWLAPGPGTGYAFATANMLFVAILVAGSIGIGQAFGLNAARSTQAASAVYFAIVAAGYVIAYLGAANLLISLVRRVGQVTMVAGALLQLLLLLLGIGIPLVVQLMSPALRGGGYSLLHITNPPWTLIYLGESSAPPLDAPLIVGLVSSAAALVFALNLPLLAAELRNVRIARPRRVVEDDTALSPPVVPQPASPWD